MTHSVHGDDTACDRYIHALELRAREKLRTVTVDSQSVRPSDALYGLLSTRLIPTLRRMGFDQQLCWSLLRSTASSWEGLTSVRDGVESMNPALIRDVKEVRRGVLQKSETTARAQSELEGLPAPARDALVRDAMRPENLFRALDDAALSWIVLPRAYDHLEREHARHLLFYTKAWDDETDVEFRKILARILIEFIGNYSVKYVHEDHCRQSTVRALFHIYSVMFWKTLRNPTAGLEDILLFECFLRWTRAIQQRFGANDREMRGAVQRMESEREKVFPSFDAFGMAPPRKRDASRLLVALRHGSPGVESVAKCFGVGPPLETQTYGRMPYASVPTALNALCRTIKRNYRAESPRTRASIRELLAKVELTYDLDRLRSVYPQGRPPEALRFVGPRVSSMSHAFATSMPSTGS